MTVEQAGTHWCPQMRHPVVQIVPTNLHAVDHVAVAVGNVYPQGAAAPLQRAGCIATRCAMWRWYDAPRDHRRGYCGLAGHVRIEP